MTEEFVIVLTLGFLIRAVWLAEEDLCALTAVYGTLHALDIREFRAVVCKDQGETLGKEFPAQSLFYDVQYMDHRRGIMVFQSKIELHMERGKMQAQDSAVIGRDTFNAVHLNNWDIVVPNKDQVILIKVSGFRNGRVWMCEGFSSGLAFYGFREVNHTDIQFTGFNKASDGGFTYGERIPVRVHNVIEGLSPAYKRADEGINGLELAGSKVEAVAGINEGIPVLQLRSLGRIKALLEMAELFLVAGIAQMKGMVQKGITKSLNIIRAVFFCLGTGFTFFLAAGRAADMSDGAVAGIDTVAASGSVDKGMFLNLPGEGRRGFVEPVRNVTEGKPFREKSLQAGTVIQSKVF